ncbi:MAG: GTP-sensing transcriptional pleiotropic repressor CodY [delta proteobacterium ML8_F1]|nr:MAG: GTP-sensing transcriptional pleiotropic repressor CodY [delta proteobacterium ML8_F1]
MISDLLAKTRQLNKVLQSTDETPVVYANLCELLKDVLDSNVYIVDARGVVLGTSFVNVEESAVLVDEATQEQYFPKSYNDSLLEIKDTRYNITKEKLLEIFENEIDSYLKFATIVPIQGGGNRLGTLVLARQKDVFNDEDLVLAEYAATVVGMEIIREERRTMENRIRQQAVVKMAIETLSYSELEAMVHIFRELEGGEGLLVASKIADRVGITRSVIVNALRKFESAGIIESRSLGMKGTHIKVLNDYLLDELFKQV